MDFLRRYLSEQKKISRTDLKREIMIRFDFSGPTASRYIDDLILMGFVKLNDDHIVYIEPTPTTRRTVP